MTNLDSILKSRDITLPTKVHQGYGFSSAHVRMWELDGEESWAPKNWCFWTVVLEKTLESPLDCKEIQPVHPKGDQSWGFIGRTDAEAETPILWPPDAKSWLIGKDPSAGRDWGQEEKGTTKDEMAGWHHRLDGHEFEWTPGVGDGQGDLACCDLWGHKEWDRTERLNWTELNRPKRLPRWLSGKESPCQWRCKRWGFYPSVKRSPGLGNSNPLQYSCLGDPMDTAACRAILHGVSNSWKCLSIETILYFSLILELIPVTSITENNPLKWSVSVVNLFPWSYKAEKDSNTPL